MVDGKSKGSSYEREVCKRLSLWVTSGQRVDCFWRSAMSGGRATVQRRKGVDVRQGGDITAVAPEGHKLCSLFYVECKHYKSLDIEAFTVSGKGRLAKFWRTAVREARAHKREPMLIARQNRLPDLVLTRPSSLKKLVGKSVNGMSVLVRHKAMAPCELRLFDDVLKAPFNA